MYVYGRSFLVHFTYIDLSRKVLQHKVDHHRSNETMHSHSLPPFVYYYSEISILLPTCLKPKNGDGRRNGKDKGNDPFQHKAYPPFSNLYLAYHMGC